MPSLNWIGKEQVVNHDKEVPFRLLKKIKSASVGENSQNMIIHGDNLEALKALMPYYYGKVKCVYIDPPYNTGNEGWVYNDKVNSPKIKKWLGKVVGGEAEDLCRHDKWLCMMYPRLKLLKELLSKDGVIFVSIDDYEVSRLKLVMDEIFDANFIAQFIWKSKTGGGNDSSSVAVEHEYILCYSKADPQDIKFVNTPLAEAEKYTEEDEFIKTRGKYHLEALYRSSLRFSESLVYPIIAPDGSKIMPNDSNPESKKHIWRWSKKYLEKMKNEKRIEFKKTKNGWRVYSKQYQLEDDEGNPRIATQRSIIDIGVGSRHGTEELKRIFDGVKIFNYPKPSELICYLINLIASKNDIILDSFAGSGTTGHSVLRLNKEDQGERKFILIQLEEKFDPYISLTDGKVLKEVIDLTTERIKRVIKLEGYAGGFEFCELDKPLFDASGQIDEDCSFEELAKYIYFTETKTNLDKKKMEKFFIGEFGEKEYYLLYTQKGVNVLNKDFVKRIPKNENKKIIYADKCLIEEDTLKRLNVEFKQIPYEVRVY